VSKNSVAAGNKGLAVHIGLCSHRDLVAPLQTYQKHRGWEENHQLDMMGTGKVCQKRRKSALK